VQLQKETNLQDDKLHFVEIGHHSESTISFALSNILL
jgi:hypothetical protein